MKDYLNKIEQLQTKCVNEVYAVLEKCKECDLSDFPFYISYCGNDDVISVRITKLKLSQFGDILLCGTDSFGNEYELDEGDDIVNYMGFDMYNSVFQSETYKKWF